MNDELIEVGTTSMGYTVYKRPNTDIGGFDYITDSIGGGALIVLSYVTEEELMVVLEDMRKGGEQ